MNNIQLCKLRRLLKYVKSNVPFYSNLLKKIDIDNLKDKEIEQLYRKIPIQDKQSMRDKQEFYSTDDSIDLFCLEKKYTGGTTGEPWCITKTKNETNKYFYALWKSRKQYGINPSDHFYQFGGYGEIEGKFITKQVIEYPNYTEFSLFNLDNDILDMYISILKRERGTWFFANPSALYLLASRMKEKNIFGIGKIKYIELTGERVYKYQEELFSEVFKCPISIMYGSRELTTISHRCKYGINHIFDHIIVDVNNGDFSQSVKQSEKSEIILTSLIDEYMPFIKYNTHDVATIGYITECSCGKKGYILEDILGREPEIIEIDGKKYHMELVFYLMDKFNSEYLYGIKQFQVEFKKPNIFIFTFVVDNPSLETIVSDFYKKELANLIPNVKVFTSFKDIINRDRRKFNPYIIEK